MTDLEKRAYAAYFRAGGNLQPNARDSGERKYKGLHYVLLRTGADILAVYRVRNDGVLRRLRRLPKGLIW